MHRPAISRRRQLSMTSIYSPNSRCGEVARTNTSSNGQQVTSYTIGFPARSPRLNTQQDRKLAISSGALRLHRNQRRGNEATSESQAPDSKEQGNAAARPKCVPQARVASKLTWMFEPRARGPSAAASSAAAGGSERALSGSATTHKAHKGPRGVAGARWPRRGHPPLVLRLHKLALVAVFLQGHHFRVRNVLFGQLGQSGIHAGIVESRTTFCGARALTSFSSAAFARLPKKPERATAACSHAPTPQRCSDGFDEDDAARGQLRAPFYSTKLPPSPTSCKSGFQSSHGS